MRRLYLLYIYAQRTPPATCGPAVESRSARTSSRTMQAGFYTIMAAQFFSSLADNALLVAAIQLLRDLESPAWMTPSLKQVFVISYVLLAPLVGAFADSMPKGRVMLVTNGIKICGCGLMLLMVHPLFAYAIVGLGAAAYSPAKYGILTELLPARQLVVANGWIEGTTVLSIIMGVVLGGALISGPVSSWLLAIDIPKIDTGVRRSRYRDRRRDGGSARLPQERREGAPAWRSDGSGGHRDGLHQHRLLGHRHHDAHRRPRRLVRRADECRVAASRPRADGRRT